MSRDFHPRKGCYLISPWPPGEDPPSGWQRSRDAGLIWRVATGEPADDAVEVVGYTDTPDCGVSNVREATR